MFNKFVEKQYVCIGVDELFQWGYKLDANPDKAFELFTSFLEEAEDTLELQDNIIQELENDNFVPLKCDHCNNCDILKDNIKIITSALENLDKVKSNLEEDEEFTYRTCKALNRMEKQEPVPVKIYEDLFDVNEEDSSYFYNPYGWKIKKI